jgi:quercetin dioxygenase-like cupin family protein
MDTPAVQKSKSHVIVEIIAYAPHSIVSKTILKNTTGNITVSSFDVGEELAEKVSPFDIYVQIIEGTAKLEINKVKHTLHPGDGIIIPAHSTHCFFADDQFKMITTIIKSVYED